MRKIRCRPVRGGQARERARRNGSLLVAILSFLGMSAQGRQAKDAPHWAEAADPAAISKKDPLVALTKDRDVPAGWLAYTAYVITNNVRPDEPAACFAVLRAVGAAANRPPVVEGVRFFPPITEFLYYCRFSPDGRYVVLGVGWPYDQGGAHHLWIWDRKTRKILSGPQQALHWADVVWSPDSSRFTYVVGGSVEGREISETDPIRLYTYDLRTSHSYFLAQAADAIWNDWSPNGQVLYSAVPPAPKGRAEGNLQDSIYEVAAQGGTPRRIITNGVEPQPSPDGRWIAYHGWPDKPPPGSGTVPPDAAGPKVPGLCLWNRATGRKTLIRPGLHGVAAQWLPDSKGLVLVEQTSTPIGNGRGQGRAKITVIGVQDLKARPVASLSVTDIQYFAGAYPETSRQFEPLPVSPDGKWICVKAQETSAYDKDYGYTSLTSLQGIDLKTGRIVLLAQTRNFLGSSFHMDWHYTAPTVPARGREIEKEKLR